MKQELTLNQEKRSLLINRLAYILYLLLVAYLLVKGDIEWATINMGVAMVFDPFDPKVKWQARPIAQKTWLLTHLALTLAGFFYLIVK